MAGYVLDSVTQQAVAGAKVSVRVDEEERTYTTDSQGYFLFEKVDPDHDYVVTVSKDGYIGNSVTYSRAELRASDGGRVLKTIYIKDESTVAKTTLKGTVKNIIDGAVSGAKVRVEGTVLEAATGADGRSSLREFPPKRTSLSSSARRATGKAGRIFPRMIW